MSLEDEDSVLKVGGQSPAASIWVLTGPRGVGKSTVCKEVASRASSCGLVVAGLLTETITSGGAVFRRAIDLRSGQSKLLAVKWERGELLHAGGKGVQALVPDPLAPGWQFDPQVFTWADEVLSGATPCDLLVLDELGPLELKGGRGWVRGVQVLALRRFRLSVVVCRPQLLDDLQKKIGGQPHVTVIEVDEVTRDTLPERIWQALTSLSV